jgi:hypothetical protein
VKSEGVATEAMPISDALDLTSVKDTFATVLLRKNVQRGRAGDRRSAHAG